jgi:hypothetical protein
MYPPEYQLAQNVTAVTQSAAVTGCREPSVSFTTQVRIGSSIVAGSPNGLERRVLASR